MPSPKLVERHLWCAVHILLHVHPNLATAMHVLRAVDSIWATNIWGTTCSAEHMRKYTVEVRSKSKEHHTCSHQHDNTALADEGCSNIRQLCPGLGLGKNLESQAVATAPPMSGPTLRAVTLKMLSSSVNSLGAFLPTDDRHATLFQVISGMSLVPCRALPSASEAEPFLKIHPPWNAPPTIPACAWPPTFVGTSRKVQQPPGAYAPRRIFWPARASRPFLKISPSRREQFCESTEWVHFLVLFTLQFCGIQLAAHLRRFTDGDSHTLSNS